MKNTDGLKAEVGVREVHGIGRYETVIRRYDEALVAYDAERVPYADRREAAAHDLMVVSKRSRDLFRVGWLIVGLGLANIVAGETLTIGAMLLLIYAPLMMLLGASWQLSAKRRVLDIEAGHVVHESKVLEARQTWLVGASRMVPLLLRSLRKRTTDEGELAEALDRLTKAQNRLRNRAGSRVAARSGWGASVELVRRCLTAAIIAAALNSVLFATVDRRQAAISIAISAVVFAMIRLAVTRRYVEQRAVAVSRMAIWNKQRDLFADLDKTVRVGVERLINSYEDHQVVIDLRFS